MQKEVFSIRLLWNFSSIWTQKTPKSSRPSKKKDPFNWFHLINTMTYLGLSFYLGFVYNNLPINKHQFQSSCLCLSSITIVSYCSQAASMPDIAHCGSDNSHGWWHLSARLWLTRRGAERHLQEVACQRATVDRIIFTIEAWQDRCSGLERKYELGFKSAIKQAPTKLRLKSQLK